MAEKGVVVKIHFGVERQQPSVLRDHEGINLGERGVRRFEGPVEAREEPARLVYPRAVEVQPEGELTRLERLEADGGVDELLQDFLRMFGRDHFDFDAALGRRHEHGASARAVNDQTQVELAVDFKAFFDQHAPYHAPLGASLMRDQRHAEHLRGQFFRFLGAAGQFHATALASTARVDLGLDHDSSVTFPAMQTFRHATSFVGLRDHLAARHRDPVARQDLLGLVFVDFHG